MSGTAMAHSEKVTPLSNPRGGEVVQIYDCR